MELFDTHCHLDEDAFAPDRDEVLQRAADAGVAAMVTIGTTAESSRLAVELAAKFATVFAVVGIQPNYVADMKQGDWETIEELVTRPKVVAVGETGLDRYWDYAPLDVQFQFFERHIALARRHNLPFVVHCREAEVDVVAQLRAASASGPLTGIMHSFSGSLNTARACLELGLHISFAGMLTYKKNDDLRSVAAQIPLERLLVETDAPYLTPVPIRGKRNEPAFVRHTVECLAEVHNMTADEMAEATSRNARALLRI